MRPRTPAWDARAPPERLEEHDGGEREGGREEERVLGEVLDERHVHARGCVGTAPRQRARI